jgi:hypothetical protein
MEIFFESKPIHVKTKQANKNLCIGNPKKNLDNIVNALRLDWSKIKDLILLHPLVPLGKTKYGQTY